MMLKRICPLLLALMLLLFPVTAFAQDTELESIDAPDMSVEEFAKQFTDKLTEVIKEDQERKKTEKPRAIALGISAAVVLVGGGFAAYKVISTDPLKKNGAQKTKEKAR